MRSAQRREIFAHAARTSCERCITSYIAAPHFRCHTEASDDRCRDVARPSRGRGSFRGGGTPPRNDFTHSRQWAGMRFSFFYKRKRELTVIQKAVADKQLHEEKATETMRTLRLQQNTSENRRKCEELKQSLSSLYYITLFPSKQQRLYEHICE